MENTNVCSDKDVEKTQNMFQQNIKIPQQIKYQPDLTNQYLNKFEINGRYVTMIGHANHLIFNHSTALPAKGIHYFEFRVIATKWKYIFFGICGETIKSAANVTMHSHFMGYTMYNGAIFGNEDSQQVVSDPKFVVGKSIIKVQIDMDKRQLSWYNNNQLLHSTPFWTISFFEPPQFRRYSGNIEHVTLIYVFIILSYIVFLNNLIRKNFNDARQIVLKNSMRMYQTDTDGEIVLIIYPANPKKNLGLKNG